MWLHFFQITWHLQQCYTPKAYCMMGCNVWKWKWSHWKLMLCCDDASQMVCKLSYVLFIIIIFSHLCLRWFAVFYSVALWQILCFVITIISKRKAPFFSLKTFNHKPCHSKEHPNSLFSVKKRIKNLNSAWTEEFNGDDELMPNSLYRHRANKWHSEI